MNHQGHNNIRNEIVWVQTGHSTCTCAATLHVIEPPNTPKIRIIRKLISTTTGIEFESAGQHPEECGLPCLDVVLCPLLSHSPSQVHRQGDLGDEVDGRDEEVLDAPEELRQPVVGVGGTQEEQGREWLAL